MKGKLLGDQEAIHRFTDVSRIPESCQEFQKTVVCLSEFPGSTLDIKPHNESQSIALSIHSPA